MHRPTKRSGFTLVELIVVISILAVLAGVVVPKVQSHVQKSRDARRLADIRAIQEAITSYYTDRGSYPPPIKNGSYGGWDVSSDGNFIDELVKTGYLSEVPTDPINDATYHYRYYVYNKGSYGCKGTTPFYVLGITKFESTGFAAEHQGFFRCSGRNWGKEFDYVVGEGATWKK